MSEKPSLSRRRFIRQTAPLMAGLSAISLANVLGSNEYLRLGWVGVGGRGSALLKRALDSVSVSTLKVTAICDIHDARRNAAIARCGGMNPVGIHDYRDLLDRVITPNGLVLKYDYDDQSRVKSVTCGDVYRLNYDSDELGRLVALSQTPVRN